jgi:predicted O-methyltransferase YrrM
MAISMLGDKTALLSLAHCDWSDGHGAKDTYLGVGALYYALAYSTKASLCVCLGSGGGFVPRMMRTAQHDCGIGPTSRTVLIDANKPEVGWGQPKWIAQDSEFRRDFDCEIRLMTTQEAAAQWPRDQKIDYLHIDADHSYKGCRHDFDAFIPLVRPGGYVTLHDTLPNPRDPRLGVPQLIKELKRAGYSIVSFPIGAGMALLQVGG